MVKWQPPFFAFAKKSYVIFTFNYLPYYCNNKHMYRVYLLMYFCIQKNAKSRPNSLSSKAKVLLAWTFDISC